MPVDRFRPPSCAEHRGGVGLLAGEQPYFTLCPPRTRGDQATATIAATQNGVRASDSYRMRPTKAKTRDNGCRLGSEKENYVLLEFTCP